MFSKCGVSMPLITGISILISACTFTKPCSGWVDSGEFNQADCECAPAVTSLSALKNVSSHESGLKITAPIIIDESTSINSDVCFVKRGRLRIQDGAVVRLDGRLRADLKQIFEYMGSESSFVSAPLPHVYPEWWGATVDDSSNDTTALRQASAFISARGAGTLEFSPGTYLVGEQQQVGNEFYPLKHLPIVEIENATGFVEIVGNGARLKAVDGLYFGYFDPITGEPQVPPSSRDCGALSSFAANAYTMINLVGNEQVEVRDLELDGNMGNLILGERCEDGRQLYGYGIRAYNNENLYVENIYAHHNALDGMVIGHTGLTEGEEEKPHHVIDLVSEYNARQGLSWVGGNSLLLERCKLNHTGKGTFSSPPGAGIDIEAEESIIRNGLIDDCEMINNTGPGLVSASGDGGYTKVINSTLWGTTSWALVVHRPGLVFEDSQIYGAVPNPYGVPNKFDSETNTDLATRFTRIHFEDREYDDEGVFRFGAALLQLEGNNVVIEDSEVFANSTRAFFLDGTDTREIVTNVNVTHSYSSINIGDYQSLFRGSHLESVHFRESFTNPPSGDPNSTQGWKIFADPAENVSFQNICVDGPWVRWNHSWWGETGCPIRDH